MMPVLVLIAFALGLMLGYYFLNRKPEEKYLATAEYWIYLPGEELPNQDQVMTRITAQNPYVQAGISPVGPKEALLFSDVRLHIALVKRSQNVHVFRPDLFNEVEVNAEILEALSNANCFVKVRYTSEEPLSDKRHVQLLIHAADAYAELGGGAIVYDTVAERIFTRVELQAMLSESVDATRPAIHIRSLWKVEPHGGRLETRGLRKIGRKELRTPTIEQDERMLISTVLEEAAFRIWDDPELQDAVEVDTYLDHFRVLLEQSSVDPTPVRILRIQET